jgi:antitoxin component YwqK of YwqJK toxin-antitoxin module
MGTTINERKRKAIELATNLYNSMLELSTHWTESGVEVSDTLPESGYPFDKSLDDLTNEVGTWIHTMKGYVPPKNGKFEYKNDDGSKFVGYYKDGKLHGTAIEYYPNTEQIDTYVEFYEGVESSPKVYFSETGTIVSIDNTLNELTPDTIGSFLKILLKKTAHKEYNGFKLENEGISDTLYLQDIKHEYDDLEINIDITKEGITFILDIQQTHIFIGHEFPKNSHEIEEYINKFHNVYVHTVTELHNTLIANLRVFA